MRSLTVQEQIETVDLLDALLARAKTLPVERRLALYEQLLEHRARVLQHRLELHGLSVEEQHARAFRLVDTQLDLYRRLNHELDQARTS